MAERTFRGSTALNPKLYNVVKYWNELFSAEKNYVHNKLVSSAVIRSENANKSTLIYNEK